MANVVDLASELYEDIKKHQKFQIDEKQIKEEDILTISENEFVDSLVSKVNVAVSSLGIKKPNYEKIFNSIKDDIFSSKIDISSLNGASFISQEVIARSVKNTLYKEDISKISNNNDSKDLVGEAMSATYIAYEALKTLEEKKEFLKEASPEEFRKICGGMYEGYLSSIGVDKEAAKNSGNAEKTRMESTQNVDKATGFSDKRKENFKKELYKNCWIKDAVEMFKIPESCFEKPEFMAVFERLLNMINKKSFTEESLAEFLKANKEIFGNANLDDIKNSIILHKDDYNKKNKDRAYKNFMASKVFGYKSKFYDLIKKRFGNFSKIDDLFKGIDEDTFNGIISMSVDDKGNLNPKLVIDALYVELDRRAQDRGFNLGDNLPEIDSFTKELDDAIKYSKILSESNTNTNNNQNTSTYNNDTYQSTYLNADNAKKTLECFGQNGYLDYSKMDQKVLDAMQQRYSYGKKNMDGHIEYDIPIDSGDYTTITYSSRGPRFDDTQNSHNINSSAGGLENITLSSRGKHIEENTSVHPQEKSSEKSNISDRIDLPIVDSKESMENYALIMDDEFDFDKASDLFEDMSTFITDSPTIDDDVSVSEPQIEEETTDSVHKLFGDDLTSKDLKGIPELAQTILEKFQSGKSILDYKADLASNFTSVSQSLIDKINFRELELHMTSRSELEAYLNQILELIKQISDMEYQASHVQDSQRDISVAETLENFSKIHHEMSGTLLSGVKIGGPAVYFMPEGSERLSNNFDKHLGYNYSQPQSASRNDLEQPQQFTEPESMIALGKAVGAIKSKDDLLGEKSPNRDEGGLEFDGEQGGSGENHTQNNQGNSNNSQRQAQDFNLVSMSRAVSDGGIIQSDLNGTENSIRVDARNVDNGLHKKSTGGADKRLDESGNKSGGADNKANKSGGTDNKAGEIGMEDPDMEQDERD